MKKKILILANSSAGLYDFRNEFVEALLAEHEVVISLPDEVKTKELTEEGVRIVRTELDRRGVNPGRDLKLFNAYRRLLKEEKPDLVLTYTIKPNIYGGFCCRIRKIPYITTITGLGSTFQKEGLLKKLIVFLYRTALKKAECVFFQNEYNLSVFDKYGIRGKKTALVPGSGVNLEKHPFEEYPSELPSGKGDMRTLRLLYVGRTMKEKGTDELLAAAEYFGEKSGAYKDPEGIRPEFLFLGYPDEDYQDILDEYEKKGYIRQLGFDPDAHKYFRDAHAVILPTYHEGMSNVLQEAAATGRPVIATDIPGCREIFEDGVTGIACKPRSAESLIEAIGRYLSLGAEERALMGKRGREKMEREFDRRKVTAAYMEEVRRIVN
ncbi:MAG: glycosyltransferase family 4 protein [Lachnospiraceae bacterium]|nr:glycosyltransferase family 4 protein [Lachnospiraceae bacterium]